MFDERRTVGKPGNYADGGFPFTIGSTRGGLHARQVSAHLAGTVHQLHGRFRNLTDLSSRRASARAGPRGSASTATGSGRGPRDDNGADELGGATLIPSGKVLHRGLRFTAVRADGKVIHGHLVNRLGKGWTAVDGYGLVNAEQAVLGH